MESNRQKQDHETNSTPHLVRLKEVIRLTKMSRSSIWRSIREGSFLTPVRIGKRAIAFHRSELTEWINSRPRIQLNGTNKEDK